MHDANFERVALITGASRGIGRAIAQALARQGYKLAINYSHNSEQAKQTAKLCKMAQLEANHDLPRNGSDDNRIICIGGDIANADACAEIVRTCENKLGSPDILVLNAGVTRDNMIMRMSEDDLDQVLSTNLRSAFLLSKLVCKNMIKNRFGRIIAISSVVSLTGNAGQTNYAASKAGLNAMIKSLAHELGSRQITANAVAPGFINTDMTAKLDSKIRDAWLERIALRRAGTPEDVAAAVAFLASDAASYITGQVLVVDGGMA